eukprot:jgi/Picsp_1/3596/NSC_06433-R1_probable lysine-specific demethylase jmj14-like
MSNIAEDRKRKRDYEGIEDEKREEKIRVAHGRNARREAFPGCSACGFCQGGCSNCRKRPTLSRPYARWNPENGVPQLDLPTLKPYMPSIEEWQDPVGYISKITPEASKFGLAHIIPPPGWDPPCALAHGTNGIELESFEFVVRSQPTSYLCCRDAVPGVCSSRYKGDRSTHVGTSDNLASKEDFGFVPLEKKQNLRSFSAYADWAKAMHFSQPEPRGQGMSTKGIRREFLPSNHPMQCDPSVEEVEAEFWRIVEQGSPGEEVEALYGQDLDTGHYGSGFPLPQWRRELLQKYLDSIGKKITVSQLKEAGTMKYVDDPWNINNMPLSKGSLLSHLREDGLITGVMIPWCYVGSCLSSFCWHIEDHALYSVNYLHIGSPKVWYGVPSTATKAFEQAMKDALPHLFEASPSLLYQLITHLSPNELKKRGVPVFRVIHQANSFVVTMPNAYHSGFNTGFNCAEAVNFAAPDWLPFGTDIAEKYVRDRKPPTISQDALLVKLATAKPAESSIQKRGTKLGLAELLRRSDQMIYEWEEGFKRLEEHGLSRENIYKIRQHEATEVESCTTDLECYECKADLWIAGVYSSLIPDKMMCLRHAYLLITHYDVKQSTIRLSYKYEPQELKEVVEKRIESDKAILDVLVEIEHARQARNTAKCVQVGPMYLTVDGDVIAENF